MLEKVIQHAAEPSSAVGSTVAGFVGWLKVQSGQQLALGLGVLIDPVGADVTVD